MLPNRIFFDDMLDDLKFNDKMKCDIYDKDNCYHVEVDVPGFDKKDIKIEVDRGTLTIKAEHTEEEKDTSKKYLHRERRFYGKYERSFYLGEVDEDATEASFENGILKIKIPKKIEQNNKKLIEIK